MRWDPQVLRDYALLADGTRGALVGPDGEIVWLCFPRWDSPGVLASLIGGDGGYQVVPAARRVWGGYYDPGTLIWNCRWVTEDGEVESRDALALPGRPGRAVLLRRLTAAGSAVPVDVVLSLRHDFGRATPTDVRQDEAGRWHGRLGDGSFCWSGVPDARVDGDDLRVRLRIEPGDAVDLVLVLAEDGRAEPVDPAAAWAATEEGWRRRVPSGTGGIAARDVRHAYAVLTGLTADSGGMIAAATLGLPERARRGRDFDYRYAWIRDQCYAGIALAAGPDPTRLDSAVRFVTARLQEHGPGLAPAYTITGAPVPDERHLDLPGYPGGADVAGNWVNGQFQLDAFGECLQLLAAAERHDRLDPDGWAAILIAAAAIEQRWQEPDSGIWEIGPAEWTHSRLACAAGLRAVARTHRAGADAGRFAALADAIVAATAATSQHRTGRWQRNPADDRVDAALLLPGIRGALPADDPRTKATLAAVLADLTDGEFAYRFRHGDQPLGGAEGAFLLCGFLVSLALLQRGDREAAARWFERTRASCGPPGLFTEEYDVLQRQLRGNLPQAFVHALLVETAHRLDCAG